MHRVIVEQLNVYALSRWGFEAPAFLNARPCRACSMRDLEDLLTATAALATASARFREDRPDSGRVCSHSRSLASFAETVRRVLWHIRVIEIQGGDPAVPGNDEISPA